MVAFDLDDTPASEFSAYAAVNLVLSSFFLTFEHESILFQEKDVSFILIKTPAVSVLFEHLFLYTLRLVRHILLTLTQIESLHSY